MSNPTPSRLHVNCDYCGAEMRKTNFKNILQKVHGKNVHLKERHDTEGEPEGDPEPETESSNMASFVRALSEAKDEIKHDVHLAKEEVLAKMETQSGIRKLKEFENLMKIIETFKYCLIMQGILRKCVLYSQK